MSISSFKVDFTYHIFFSILGLSHDTIKVQEWRRLSQLVSESQLTTALRILCSAFHYNTTCDVSELLRLPVVEAFRQIVSEIGRLEYDGPEDKVVSKTIHKWVEHHSHLSIPSLVSLNQFGNYYETIQIAVTRAEVTFRTRIDRTHLIYKLLRSIDRLENIREDARQITLKKIARTVYIATIADKEVIAVWKSSQSQPAPATESLAEVIPFRGPTTDKT